MRHHATTRLRPRRTTEASRSFAGVGLVLAALLAISACSPAGPASNVQVSSPTVASQGQLALNATATFDVSVLDPEGLHDADDLRYHWTLDAERGTYLLDDDEETTDAVTTAPTIRLRGDVAGAEAVRVTVVDSASGSTVGVGSLVFDIVVPSSNSLCYDGTTLVVLHGYSPWATDSIELATGKRTRLQTAAVNDVSRDGNWYTGWRSTSGANTQIFISRCDGVGYRNLTSGEHYEDSPVFSPDGRYIYFLRRSPDENVLFPGRGLPGYMEVARVDVETGATSVLTNLNANAEGAQGLAMSPDGTRLAFVHLTASKGTSSLATFEYEYELVTMPAGGGPLSTLTYLGDYVPVHGIDWAPDGSHVLFSWDASRQSDATLESGIYRVHFSGGGGAQLIFPDPSPDSLPPRKPTYYAGGTRIAWSGQEYGDTTSEVWSIDANGADVQRLTSDVGSARLMTVWDPY